MAARKPKATCSKFEARTKNPWQFLNIGVPKMVGVFVFLFDQTNQNGVLLTRSRQALLLAGEDQSPVAAADPRHQTGASKVLENVARGVLGGVSRAFHPKKKTQRKELPILSFAWGKSLPTRTGGLNPRTPVDPAHLPRKNGGRPDTCSRARRRCASASHGPPPR